MLMWLDDDKDAKLPDVISAGAKRYTEKFGKPPTVCYIHRSREADVIDGIKIVPATFVHGMKLYFFGDENE